jgi:hypothetical protein
MRVRLRRLTLPEYQEEWLLARGTAMAREAYLNKEPMPAWKLSPDTWFLLRNLPQLKRARDIATVRFVETDYGYIDLIGGTL